MFKKKEIIKINYFYTSIHTIYINDITTNIKKSNILIFKYEDFVRIGNVIVQYTDNMNNSIQIEYYKLVLKNDKEYLLTEPQFKNFEKQLKYV